MAFIDWSDSLSVKIDSIDEQHKKLIGMINNFYENLKSKSNNDLILKLINDMGKYVIEHFKYEEDLFKKYNYSLSEEHKQEHYKFIEKITSLQQKLNDGSMILSFEITGFLKDWLKNHIQHTDMKYVDFFLEKGVK